MDEPLTFAFPKRSFGKKAPIYQLVNSHTGDKTASILFLFLLGNCLNLAQLSLVMPANNASSERSFSALRRVKNYLRTSIYYVARSADASLCT